MRNNLIFSYVSFLEENKNYSDFPQFEANRIYKYILLDGAIISLFILFKCKLKISKQHNNLMQI